MKRELFSVVLLLLAFSITAVAQTLPEAEKEKQVALTCALVKADQQYRQSPYSDSISRAYRDKDTTAIYHFSSLLTSADSANFAMLEEHMNSYGFPGEKLLGPKTCDLTSVFIHWENGYPTWFNSANNIKLFKKEIQKGNMPVTIVDSAHAYFVRRTMHDMEYFTTINETRKKLGLRPYTESQFMRETSIDPVKKN
jgi:hypothetical protein